MHRDKFYVYCSHFLSAWGDRMWAFAVGLFLVELSPGSLRLTASYGFASGGAILLLGAIIGDWVDRYHRFKVAQSALAVQNSSLCISAGSVALLFTYREQIIALWEGLEPLCLTVILVTAVVADVAGVTRQVSIERDWIVVMCHGDDQQLTALSAQLRRIDLLTNILAPIVTGQIISATSPAIGAAFIAAWNLVSFAFEYTFLYLVFKSYPGLQYKAVPTDADSSSDKTGLVRSSKMSTSYGAIRTALHRSRSSQSVTQNPTQNQDLNDLEISRENLSRSGSNVIAVPWYKRFVQPLFILVRGWKIYMAQKIRLAGISLSMLYLTVLGFDSVTVGYAQGEGVPEWVVGVLMAAGALFGIVGTLLYPVFRRRLGLNKTGIISFNAEVLCLLPCIVAIFVPGSNFEPGFLFKDSDLETNYTQVDNVTLSMNSTETPYPVNVSYFSVGLLMAGIVISRIGLWMSDLTVTQLLLETPQNDVRGTVNGVQNSLNKLVDILKFLLVILLPWPETFGYLVIASFLSVAIGVVLYMVYACTQGTDTKPQADTSKNDAGGENETLA